MEWTCTQKVQKRTRRNVSPPPARLPARLRQRVSLHTKVFDRQAAHIHRHPNLIAIPLRIRRKHHATIGPWLASGAVGPSHPAGMGGRCREHARAIGRGQIGLNAEGALGVAVAFGMLIPQGGVVRLRQHLLFADRLQRTDAVRFFGRDLLQVSQRR